MMVEEGGPAMGVMVTPLPPYVSVRLTRCDIADMLLRPRVRPPLVLLLPLLQLDGLLPLLTKAAEAIKGPSPVAAQEARTVVVAKRRPCVRAKVICVRAWGVGRWSESSAPSLVVARRRNPPGCCCCAYQ